MVPLRFLRTATTTRNPLEEVQPQQLLRFLYSETKSVFGGVHLSSDAVAEVLRCCCQS